MIGNLLQYKKKREPLQLQYRFLDSIYIFEIALYGKQKRCLSPPFLHSSSYLNCLSFAAFPFDSHGLTQSSSSQSSCRLSYALPSTRVAINHGLRFHDNNHYQTQDVPSLRLTVALISIWHNSRIAGPTKRNMFTLCDMHVSLIYSDASKNA